MIALSALRILFAFMALAALGALVASYFIFDARLSSVLNQVSVPTLLSSIAILALLGTRSDAKS